MPITTGPPITTFPIPTVDATTNAVEIIAAIGAETPAGAAAQISAQISGITPQSIGAETPEGAQTKADTAAAAVITAAALDATTKANAALASALAADVVESQSSLLTKLEGATPQAGKIGEEFISPLFETVVGAQAKADEKITPPIVIFDGDSLSTGTSWHTRLLDSVPLFKNAEVYYPAVAGQHSGQRAAAITTTLTGKTIKPNQFALYSLLVGFNDVSLLRDVNTIYADIKTCWAAARAAGFKILAFTVHKSRYNIAPAREAIRVQLNTLIRSDSSLYDYFVDQDDLFFGYSSETRDTTHYSNQAMINVSRSAAAALAGTKPMNLRRTVYGIYATMAEAVADGVLPGETYLDTSGAAKQVWSPGMIPGLGIDIDVSASSSILDSTGKPAVNAGTVATLRDNSPNNRAFEQADDTLRGMLDTTTFGAGRPVVNLDGTDDGYELAGDIYDRYTMNPSFHIFIVANSARASNTATQDTIFSGGASSFFHIQKGNNTNTLFIQSPPSTHISGGSVIGSPLLILEVEYTATTITLRIGGATVATGNHGGGNITNLGQLNLGYWVRQSGISFRPWSGKFAQMLIYDRTLSADQATWLRARLSEKWID